MFQQAIINEYGLDEDLTGWPKETVTEHKFTNYSRRRRRRGEGGEPKSFLRATIKEKEK